MSKKNNDIQYFIHPKLRDQAHSLYRRGGPYRSAAEKVLALIELVSSGHENPLSAYKTTNHGEDRINHCIKYDITGRCRLITVQTKKKVILLFVGSHDETEKWLNSHRGTRFVERGGEIDYIRLYITSKGREDSTSDELCYSSGQLFEQLSTKEYDWVADGVARSDLVKIEKLNSFSSDKELYAAINGIRDETKKMLFLDLLLSLKSGDLQEAKRRILFEQGEYKELPESPVVSGPNIQQIPVDDPTYSQLFEHFVKTADYKQWMLFMHPDQQAMVDVDFSVPAKLIGVSGSGKTCVVVKRAVRLAQKYPKERILVVTLNRSLAALIKELVDTVAIGDIRQYIDVKPLFQVCQQY